MRRFTAIVMLLVSASTALAIKVTLFSDIPRFVTQAQDMIIARCDQVGEPGDDKMTPVAVTVQSVLKGLEGQATVGTLKIVTIYPMHPGKSYLLTSLGGSMQDIRFFAVEELAVVELPDNLNLADLRCKKPEEQVRTIFDARRIKVEQQLASLKSEKELLDRAAVK